jgi:hypothetical protein
MVAGYQTATAAPYGFSTTYRDNVDDFLSLCDANNIKVIPVLYIPKTAWADVMYRIVGGETRRLRPFRKTAFDKTDDTLVYGSDGAYKYECDDPTRTGGAVPSLKDHTTMFDNYKQAAVDFLNLFSWHESLWGIDIFNEPLYGFAPASSGSPANAWFWHGLGYNVYDTDEWIDRTEHRNHCLRGFLADTYDAVKTWCGQAGNRDIKVVCDIAQDNCDYPLQFVDMGHPWATNPSAKRKTCDVFGVHWYQKYHYEAGPPAVPPTTVDSTYLWSGDSLARYHTTEWMAEKPLMITETVRYWQNDWDRTFNGDQYFEDGQNCATYTCNDVWYEDYLDKGQHRHIESYIFWSGDGASWMKPLVWGAPAATPESYADGWVPDEGSYDLGLAGGIIYNY